MAHTWKIAFDSGLGTQASSDLITGHVAYHFFQDRSQQEAEAVESYGDVLDFKDTSDIFDFLAFTQSDIADVLEVDPSTLF